MIIENGAAEVREEREDTPSAVPKSAVADDSDDEILIVDTSKERGQAVSGASPPQSTAPIVHNINEGDDECMMLEVVELPTGATSHAVAAPREKKFKCSMCSEMFIRKKTRDHHEQTSHRNDIISDTCEEV
ncbi:unnamed protein product [Heligmosomoides polygyrus]|uniref:C2H2-type domain-containing protein n=1 Tax=Heligmosomoides polygyrus TaxID=6339 RepID=A0A183GWG4_HELPZ|nr:unnamed protein product [Heligmosomoides polygyrus]